MKKPELVVTPKSIEDIPKLIEAGADAFIIGEEQFGLRLAGDFDLPTLTKAVSLIKENQKKVYVAINGLFANSALEPLKSYLEQLSNLEVDALRFSDPGAYMIAKEIAPQIPLHWSSETLGTNYFTANYWEERGVYRTVLAPELMKESVLEINEHAKGEIEILVHGAICMFQSRRNLVGNYLKFQGQVVEKLQTRDQGLTLFDPERQLYYPIFEDIQGTHIFNGTDICMVDDLQEFIEAGIDSFRIDGVLKSSEYLLYVTNAYRLAIDTAISDAEKYAQIGRPLYKKLEEVQPLNRNLDRGFYYKPSMYKHK
ncbi:MAG TPA: collagenase-like protease [Firmicutes bacterium]|nr:collagenase-like protease [Bacillota bacterium]